MAGSLPINGSIMARSRPAAVVCACIDIGSNTTRLLVGECLGDRVRPRLEERAFTGLGAGMPVPPERVEEIASAVAWQVARARAAGAERVRLGATARGGRGGGGGRARR